MERFNLAKDTAVNIDFERGEIAEITYKNQRINEGRVPMFSVKLRKRTGESRILSSYDCAFVSFTQHTACYTCDFFDVDVRFEQKGDALLWRANIRNKTQDLLEWIELMSFSVAEKLKDEEGGKGEIVYPYNEGCRVTNMAYRESMPFRYKEPDYPSKNTFSIFPNMVFAQFVAYMQDGVGIYLGMHDAERTTKHIDFCYCNGKIKVFMRSFCDVDYGQSYTMPFDCVLEIFQGDWYAAADIYYRWFSQNRPDGLKKIEENSALPAWYSKNPLVVAYPLRGKCDTDMSANGLYPYKNALPLLEEIADKTDCKIMALLMHWEGTAPWAPPFVWPPYGKTGEFEEFADELHAKDMCVGLYCSGLGWTQESQIDKTYHCEAEFETLHIADHLCSNSNGELKSTICLQQRNGYDFCPASETTKKIFKEEFEKVSHSKVDYVQALDQNHGGASYFCYSDKHGHTPAPGKWQQTEMLNLLSSIDKNGILFGCESAAAEPFLTQLQFSDNRFELNYYLGTPIPVYAYLYHEYVNNFMGNQICAMLEKSENNFTYRLAYAFTAGDMLTVVMDGQGDILHAWCDYVEPREKHVDKDVAFAFIKTLNSWRQKGGKNFLNYGKMVAPIGVCCTKEKFLLEDKKTYLVADSVLSSAYEYGGERVQFLVNYNLAPVDVALGKKCEVYFDSDLRILEKGADKITIAPLSVAMIKWEK